MGLGNALQGGGAEGLELEDLGLRAPATPQEP